MGWCHVISKIRMEPGVLTNVRCNLQVVHIIPLSCKKRTNTLDFHFFKFISTNTCTDACAITAMLKNVRTFVDNNCKDKVELPTLYILILPVQLKIMLYNYQRLMLLLAMLILLLLLRPGLKCYMTLPLSILMATLASVMTGINVVVEVYVSM